MPSCIAWNRILGSFDKRQCRSRLERVSFELGQTSRDTFSTLLTFFTCFRIQEITPEGIIAADGKERKVDIIVCATGFDCSWRPRFTLKGRNGYQIGDKWAEEPRSYMSIAIEEMPNYFIFNGPYNCGGNGCAVPPIEVEGDYSKDTSCLAAFC